MTSNDLKRPQKIDFLEPNPNTGSSVIRTTNKKNRSKCVSMHEIGDINDECLDETFHKINL